jgi:hypothetical protein
MNWIRVAGGHFSYVRALIVVSPHPREAHHRASPQNCHSRATRPDESIHTSWRSSLVTPRRCCPARPDGSPSGHPQPVTVKLGCRNLYRPRHPPCPCSGRLSAWASGLARRTADLSDVWRRDLSAWWPADLSDALATWSRGPQDGWESPARDSDAPVGRAASLTFAPLVQHGVEGTGSYGAGLTLSTGAGELRGGDSWPQSERSGL